MEIEEQKENFRNKQIYIVKKSIELDNDGDENQKIQQDQQFFYICINDKQQQKILCLMGNDKKKIENKKVLQLFIKEKNVIANSHSVLKYYIFNQQQSTVFYLIRGVQQTEGKICLYKITFNQKTVLEILNHEDNYINFPLEFVANIQDFEQNQQEKKHYGIMIEGYLNNQIKFWVLGGSQINLVPKKKIHFLEEKENDSMATQKDYFNLQEIQNKLYIIDQNQKKIKEVINIQSNEKFLENPYIFNLNCIQYQSDFEQKIKICISQQFLVQNYQINMFGLNFEIGIFLKQRKQWFKGKIVIHNQEILPNCADLQLQNIKMLEEDQKYYKFLLLIKIFFIYKGIIRLEQHIVKLPKNDIYDMIKLSQQKADMQVKEKGFLMQDQGLQEEEKELEKKIVQEKRYNSQILKYNVGNELVQNEQNIIFVKSKLNMSNFQIEEEYEQMEMEGEIMGSEYIQFYNFLQQQIITIPIQLKEN